jgi:hypothetical protein
MANKITNKHNLPQTLVNLAENRDYSRGASDRSITQLIDSPRVSVLRMRNENRIEEDVVDTFWANLGSALHHITERGADDKHLVEERLFTQVGTWTISGAIDVQRIEDDGSVTVMDYKFTSVWAVKNPKPDWEKQLNCYAYLVAKEKNSYGHLRNKKNTLKIGFRATKRLLMAFLLIHLCLSVVMRRDGLEGILLQSRRKRIREH